MNSNKNALGARKASTISGREWGPHLSINEDQKWNTREKEKQDEKREKGKKKSHALKNRTVG